jgi:hypothetical protein
MTTCVITPQTQIQANYCHLFRYRNYYIRHRNWKSAASTPSVARSVPSVLSVHRFPLITDYLSHRFSPAPTDYRVPPGSGIVHY